MWKRVALGLGGLIVALVVIVGGRAMSASSRQLQVEAVAPPAGLDADAAAGRLSRAIQIRTVSQRAGFIDSPEAFAELEQFLYTNYPQATAALAPQRVGAGLLYRWQGSDPSLDPVMWIAHLDVVPGEAHGDAHGDSDWTWPPYSGARQDGFIWGRGALDDKNNALAMLEAVELALGAGFQPTRTLYLGFGEDEETGGTLGAQRLAAEVQRRHPAGLHWLLDEGLIIADGIVPGLEPPAALIGLAEKAYLSIELTVAGAGGHSSMPPQPNAAGVLAMALARLETSPAPAAIDGPTREMFAQLGPEMAYPHRALFTNLWLTSPLLLRVLGGKPTTNASVRTTCTPTMLQGSNKDNVLPQVARAVINCRIHPRETVQQVLDRLETIFDDERVEMALLEGGFNGDPVPISTSDSDGFRALERTVRETFDDVVVGPGLMIGATDSRHYMGLTDQIFRFSPYVLTSEDTPRIHGIDERVSEQGHADGIAFYHQLLHNSLQ